MAETSAAPSQSDSSPSTLDEAFARQAKRAGLLSGWLDGLDLRPGARVIDVGAGTGYFSFELAQAVGPDGIVFAVDCQAEALAYLKGRREANGGAEIRPIVADAAALDLAGERVDAALVAMVLHHAENPPGVLHGVARCLPTGSRAVVAEFHPDRPGTAGAPHKRRVDPDQVRRWCEDAGLTVVCYVRQSPEHYMLVVVRQ